MPLARKRQSPDWRFLLFGDVKFARAQSQLTPSDATFMKIMGWAQPTKFVASRGSATRRNARNLLAVNRLRHNSRTPGVGGSELAL